MKHSIAALLKCVYMSDTTYDPTVYDPDEAFVLDTSRSAFPEWKQRRIFELRKEREREIAEEEAERRSRRPRKRSYVKRPFAPEYVSGNLTLIDHDWQPGANGGYYCDGYWLARCICGATVRVHTSWLRLGLRRAMTCGKCPLPKRYSDTGDTAQRGHPPLDLAGKPIGRLTPIRFIRSIGWLCQCECGGECVLRNSAAVKHAGFRPCDGSCVKED